ncbi:MAG: site-specific integrase [Lachnospiraceae bacterium]|nr:site-specific integrase [Lachnospiraceae bacterium]
MGRTKGEGSFDKQVFSGGKERWRYRRNGHATYGNTKKEALDKWREWEKSEKVKVKKNPKTSKLYTFGEFCNDWLMMRSDLAYNTRKTYEDGINKRMYGFKAYDIANKQLKSLNADMFTAYFEALALTYSKETIDKQWHIVKQVLEYGMDEEVIPQFRIGKIKIPKAENIPAERQKLINYNEQTKFPLDKHIKALYDFVISNKKFADGGKVISFLSWSGLRVSEAIGLKWKNVSEDFSEIHIRQTTQKINGEFIDKLPKTQNGIRSVPIQSDEGKTILKYFADKFGREPEQYVFLNRNGSPFDRNALGKSAIRVCKSLNFEGLYSPHDWRHAYGSSQLRNGVPIEIVSRLLGHSSVQTTYDIYIHTDDKNVKEQLEKSYKNFKKNP